MNSDHLGSSKGTAENLAELLREARDNCLASIAEDGISVQRKEYRMDLHRRLCEAIAAMKE